MKKARITALFLIVCILLAGCGKTAEKEEKTETAAEEQIKTEEIPEEKTAGWDGVYSNNSGVFVIKNHEGNIFEFTASRGADLLNGICKVEEDTAEYSEAGYGFFVSVSETKLVLVEEGNNPYSKDGFGGIYTKTDIDPESFVITVDESEFAEEKKPFDLYNGVDREAVFHDPMGRYSVTIPDMFEKGPDEAQPEDGIYMENPDGSAYLNIAVQAKIADTPEELAEYLDSQFGILAAVRPDGMVAFSDRFTDGENNSWASFAYMRILEHIIVRADYVFAEEAYDRCEPGCSLINIK